MPSGEGLEGRLLMAAGQLDPSFGNGGRAVAGFETVGLPFGGAEAVAVQSDGRIVIAGFARAGFDQGADFVVARFNPDGTLDPSFGAGGRARVGFGDGPGTTEDTASALGIMLDGRIVVAGSTGGNMGAVRLNADGSIDTTFGTNGRAIVSFDLVGDGADTEDAASALAIQPDGRVILAGYATRNLTGDTSFAASRLNVDGSIDTTFGANGRATVDFNLGGNFNDQATAVVIQPDGRIVLAGYAINATNTFDYAVTRLTTNGLLDTSFGAGGLTSVNFGINDTNDRANAVALGPNGRIAVAGLAGGEMGVVMLTANGQVDLSFTPSGRATIGFDLGGTNADTANAVLFEPDGRVVLVGSAETGPSGQSQFAAARLTLNGAPDPTFGNGGRSTFDFGPGNYEVASGAARLVDGRIVMAGTANISQNVNALAVAVLQNDDIQPPPAPTPPALPPGSTPADQAAIPPRILEVRPGRTRRGVESVILTLNTAVRADQAGNPRTYFLRLAGRDRRFGTRDDLRVPIRSVQLIPGTNQVSLVLARPFRGQAAMQLFIGAGTLQSPSGTAFDGDGNGSPGGDFAFVVPRR